MWGGGFKGITQKVWCVSCSLQVTEELGFDVWLKKYLNSSGSDMAREAERGKDGLVLRASYMWHPWARYDQPSPLNTQCKRAVWRAEGTKGKVRGWGVKSSQVEEGHLHLGGWGYLWRSCESAPGWERISVWKLPHQRTMHGCNHCGYLWTFLLVSVRVELTMLQSSINWKSHQLNTVKALFVLVQRWMGFGCLAAACCYSI